MTPSPPFTVLPRLFVCLLLLGSSIAGASVTYTYQGQLLVTNFSAPLAFGDSVTGSITFAGTVATGNFSAADFIDYDFKIAGFRLSKAGGAGASAQFVIDGGGAITSWSFVVGDYSSAAPPHLVEIWTNSADLSPSQERIIITDTAGGTNLASAAPPGNWTLVPVPEPASAALVMVSAAALLIRRRRARHDRPG